MDEKTEAEYFKIKTIIQKPIISKIDLTKINRFLEKTSLVNEYFIVRLFIISLESGHFDLADLILPKFEDINNGVLQSEFMTICTNNDIDAIQYLFNKGFMIEDSNYQILINMGTQVKPEIIQFLKDLVKRKKIEKIRNR